ncbi:MAG: pilus assembly protein [Candidatus Dormibacteraeota bacterium]|nr:pilus assembly protein [Candidatus Dormibacteraeota bacterium]
MRRRSPAPRGQSLVEFALVLPLLLLLLAGGVDLARAYFVGIEVSNAAREASLYLARNAPFVSSAQYSSALPPSGTETGCPSPGGTEGPAVDAGCASFHGTFLSCPSSEMTWRFSPTDLPPQSGTDPATDSFTVTVTATCRLDLLTPLLPPAVTIGGSSTSLVVQP